MDRNHAPLHRRGPGKALAKIAVGQCDKCRIRIGVSHQGID